MPEGKQPGEPAAARGEDGRLSFGRARAPVNVPVPPVHQASVSDRYTPFTIHPDDKTDHFSVKNRGRLSPWWLQNVDKADFKIHLKKMSSFPGIMERRHGLP